MATRNLPVYMRDDNQLRPTDVPIADWQGGMNLGGSNAPGIGINTGNYNPKASDWPRIADTAPRNSQHIGTVPAPLEVDQGVDKNDNVAFVQADSNTAPDGVLDVTTGAVNKTGATVPANAWVWGVIPVA